jgi:hypothetical protein
MAEIIQVSDLPTAVQTAELVAAMVAGANAKASRVAPCLTWDGTEDGKPVPTDDQLAEAKLILIGAVKRWAEAGSGALQAQTAGPFGVTVDNRQRTGFNLWPSEITDLQNICKTDDAQKGAFSIDTAPSLSGMHVDWCSLNLGALYCSCGVDIAGEPIYELG